MDNKVCPASSGGPVKNTDQLRHDVGRSPSGMEQHRAARERAGRGGTGDRDPRGVVDSTSSEPRWPGWPVRCKGSEVCTTSSHRSRTCSRPMVPGCLPHVSSIAESRPFPPDLRAPRLRRLTRPFARVDWGGSARLAHERPEEVSCRHDPHEPASLLDEHVADVLRHHEQARLLHGGRHRAPAPGRCRRRRRPSSSQDPGRCRWRARDPAQR